ncbi:MAG TPA: DUF924 family protein [Myxococcota bacterium]|nr:DUF924 family protein [Myxococcota bacterium]
MDPLDLVTFWFGPDDDSDISARSPSWFRVDPAFDATLRERFGAWLLPAGSGGLRDWEGAPASALALTLTLDQLPRNLHRGTPSAFLYDAAALAVARRAIGRGYDRRLSPPRRAFLYLPFMHSEERATHAESLALYEGLAVAARGGPWEAMTANNLTYAIRHAEIVDRFGRYPHRNAALGRASTDEEARFLTQPGSGF